MSKRKVPSLFSLTPGFTSRVQGSLSDARSARSKRFERCATHSRQRELARFLRREYFIFRPLFAAKCFEPYFEGCNWR